MKSNAAASSKFSGSKTVIDCSIPAADNLIDPAELEQFLHDNIKVDGKTGNFEQKTADGSVRKRVQVLRENHKIIIEDSTGLNKRTIKFLTKRYIAKCMLRDYLRIVARSPDSYVISYFRAPTAKIAA